MVILNHAHSFQTASFLTIAMPIIARELRTFAASPKEAGQPAVGSDGFGAESSLTT
jgi:hypothetical protein